MSLYMRSVGDADAQSIAQRDEEEAAPGHVQNPGNGVSQLPGRNVDVMFCQLHGEQALETGRVCRAGAANECPGHEPRLWKSRSGSNFDVVHPAGGRRNGQTILPEPFEVKLNRLADTVLDFLNRRPGRDAAGKVGDVGRIIAVGEFDDDCVTHGGLPWALEA